MSEQIFEMSETRKVTNLRALRSAFGAFATGVTVITTLDASGRPTGLTASSFNTVSLEPPLVLWSQSLRAPSHPAFHEAAGFSVNVLAADQVEISNRFSQGSADKFAGIDWMPGHNGAPLIPGCAAYFECSTESRYPGGDHTIFVGSVLRFESSGRAPLIFGGGRYLRAGPLVIAGSH